MTIKTDLLVPALVILITSVLLLSGFSSGVYAQSAKVISGSPGDTLSYTGMATPNSQVYLEVSASIGVGTYQSGDKYYYKSSMNNLNVPGGNSMSITVSPVDTLSVSGAFSSAPMISDTMSGSVNTDSHVGTFSKGVPPAHYNIVVFGIANGSPSSVTMSVKASQPQTVGSDGTYTASISTSGLPSAVYTVKQNGMVVAMVYLGVTAPATPTPVPTPTPAPSRAANATVTASQGAGLLNNNTSTTGNTTIPVASANSSTNGTAATGTASASPALPESGLGTWGTAILAIACGTIIGIVAAYLLIIRKR